MRRWFDDEQIEALLEDFVPLPDLYPDEFQQYCDLFIKYFPKRPCHIKSRYDRGFVCIKGRRRTGEPFDIPCYPALVAKMLDYERWKTLHPDKPRYDGCWIALREPRKTALKAIDFDNKVNVLAYWSRGYLEDHAPIRPLTTMTVDHFKEIKRLYREFPGHIWCVSSSTLGLHIWEKLPGLRDTQDIQIITKTRLQRIGLGGTEVHPMPGRAFRRPFGQDYYTITDNGILDHWTDQLSFFKNPHTPTFGSIFSALRLLLGRNLADAETCPVAKLSWKDIQLARTNLERMDEWAERGFPDGPPVSEPVVISWAAPLSLMIASISAGGSALY